jgi:hypothetical protein
MYDDAALEDALSFLADFGPDLANGMTSHAPMVVETLAAHGRGDSIACWLEAQRPLLLPRPKPVAPIARERWREALGREERSADWAAFFAAELAESPWQQVLGAWGVRLAPGLCAAATHGPIRVAHAARAIARADTALRRDELAVALGHWAATYQTLPTAAPAGARGTHALGALLALERVPVEARRFEGTITGALAVLDAHAPFAPAIHRFDATRPAPAAISELSEAFARVFVANAQDTLSAIVFVHGITSAAALREIAPHVPAEVVPTLLASAWQAGAALYATFATAPPQAEAIAAPAGNGQGWLDRAVASGDDHAIKGVAACLGEHAIAASPAYLAAAERAISILAT